MKTKSRVAKRLRGKQIVRAQSSVEEPGEEIPGKQIVGKEIVGKEIAGKEIEGKQIVSKQSHGKRPAHHSGSASFKIMNALNFKLKKKDLRPGFSAHCGCDIHVNDKGRVSVILLTYEGPAKAEGL